MSDFRGKGNSISDRQHSATVNKQIKSRVMNLIVQTEIQTKRSNLKKGIDRFSGATNQIKSQFRIREIQSACNSSAISVHSLFLSVQLYLFSRQKEKSKRKLIEMTISKANGLK